MTYPIGHAENGWQSFYAAPNRGQQYRCILCGQGGASASDGPKPLTYNCMVCMDGDKNKHTMWPTPQYTLYREQVVKVERLIHLLNLAEHYLTDWTLNSVGQGVETTAYDREQMRQKIEVELRGETVHAAEERVKETDRLRAALQQIADGCNEPDAYASLILKGIL
jgi:hypothetical protein